MHSLPIALEGNASELESKAPIPLCKDMASCVLAEHKQLYQRLTESEEDLLEARDQTPLLHTHSRSQHLAAILSQLPSCDKCTQHGRANSITQTW